jgi:methylated-DNA-[protein]-cysteine S-methyltransferase
MDTSTLRATRRHTVTPTVLGEITLVASGDVLEGLYFPGHWYLPDRATFGPRADDGFDGVIGELGEYLAGQRCEFGVPMRARGDATQRRVWDLIAQVPYGSTTSYGALAAQLGAGVDAREVGAAVGRNPLCILIPCHRVISSTGKLTGYAGGLRRKQHLLDLERARTTTHRPSVPGRLW